MNHGNFRLNFLRTVGQARLGGALAIVALLALSLTAWGQKPKLNPLAPKTGVEQKTAPVSTTSHEMTPADVEAFLDGLVPVQIQRDNIAGAVIAVVKDGKVIFAKGYGYSDVKKKTPVSATDTLFRPGSISKTFTWTAVMQLVQQGKIDLDRDVNDYLDFKIPNTFPQPITMRNIMTHTSGYGETIDDLFVPDVKDLTDLRTYVVNHMPKRIFPPGTVPAYSNYATTLAGYIVQRVSGKPFNDYIQENIFTPLGMEHTTFAQPLPDNLKPLMSNGYREASSPAGPWEVVQAWPAGSVSTTAMDMTHFMLAHLANGEYNGAKILNPETAQLMHSRQFAANPAMSGMCLGFYEETRNGHRIIGHGGDTEFFHSDLHLVLDAGVGFFVSYNSLGNSQDSDREVLWHKFLDRYFPYTPPQGETIANAAADAREVSGLYNSSRRPEGDILGALAMLGEAKVYTNPDGTISADAVKDSSGTPEKFKEIAPLIYRDIDGQDRMAFKRDASGNLFFVLDWPFMTFQRVGGVQSKTFNYVVLIFGIAIMALTLILWPVSAFVRRHYGRKLLLPAGARRLRLIVRLTCAADLIFIAGLAALLSSLDAPGALNSHGSLLLWIHVLQVIGLLGVIGTVLVVYNAIRIWSVKTQTALAAATTTSGGESVTSGGPSSQPIWIWSKVFAVVIAVACIGMAWFFIYWDLLNFNLNF